VAQLPAALRVDGLAWYVGAPFSLHGQPYGLFSVFHQTERRFSLDEISVLTALARQMGLLIENSHSQQQLSRIAMLEERQRLARDLHDVVSQTLFSASIMAESLPDLWDKAPQDIPPLLRKLHHLNRGALAEMRSLLLELRPQALEKTGLHVLLKQLGYAAVGTTPLTLTLDLQPETNLPPEIKINLYRIAQEAVNNVIKHAHATSLTLSLQVEPAPATAVILRISDDGRGFDPAQVEPGRLGLHILQERATAIDAQLTIKSQPGQGATVVVEWPAG
jgi:two-component system nitrate/nitrite sensor histidine kinase NarX